MQKSLTDNVQESNLNKDPAAYMELIMEGDPKRYLQAVTRCDLPEEMK